jgi:hypothetical protein
VAAQGAQHDVQAQEEAPKVPGAGRPVGAVEAVRGCRDPDVHSRVCRACSVESACIWQGSAPKRHPALLRLADVSATNSLL